MSEIKVIGITGGIPISSKYKPIIESVKSKIRQLETGSVLEVQLDRANEASNLAKSLEKHVGKSFKVSVRTEEDVVKGYVQLLSE